MTQEGFKRKLSEILSADVECYRRLIGEDQKDTIRALTPLNKAMSKLVPFRETDVGQASEPFW